MIICKELILCCLFENKVNCSSFIQESVDRKFSQLMRLFCVLHWEEILTKIPHLCRLETPSLWYMVVQCTSLKLQSRFCVHNRTGVDLLIYSYVSLNYSLSTPPPCSYVNINRFQPGLAQITSINQVPSPYQKKYPLVYIQGVQRIWTFGQVADSPGGQYIYYVLDKRHKSLIQGDSCNVFRSES